MATWFFRDEFSSCSKVFSFVSLERAFAAADGCKDTVSGAACAGRTVNGMQRNTDNLSGSWLLVLIKDRWQSINCLTEVFCGVTKASDPLWGEFVWQPLLYPERLKIHNSFIGHRSIYLPCEGFFFHQMRPFESHLQEGQSHSIKVNPFFQVWCNCNIFFEI